MKFPISWLNIQGYCEYSLYLQYFKGITTAPTKAMTGGFGTEDIIKKVVTPTDKLDKNGNVVKITTYEFIYPETIIPTVEEDCPEVEVVPSDMSESEATE